MKKNYLATRRTKTASTFFISAFLVLSHGTLLAQLSGTKTVCASGCNYPTLTGTGGLFEAINTNGLGGNLTVTINGDLTEPGTVGLNNISVGSANSITIKPNAATLYTISGSSVDATTTPFGLIRINGGDNITINGNFSGSGKYLLFRNASSITGGSSTVPALAFDNSAANDVVSNCYIESNGSNGLRAPLLVSSNGTNTVTISSCDIRNTTAGASGKPSIAINSNGAGNTVQILNNNIYNFTQTGISITNTLDACTVTGNSIYSTVPSTIDFSTVTGIIISSGGGHTVSNNYIGGSGPLCTGTWSYTADGNFTGIQMNNSIPTASSIQGNTIQNINMSNLGGLNGSCTLIDLGAGSYDVGTATGNTLGHALTANSIVVSPEGPTGVIGIRCSGSSGTVNIANNTIANIAAPSNFYGIITLRGIEHSGANTLNASGNDIHSLSSAGNTQDPVTGIYSSGTAINNTFSRNRIYDLRSLSTSGAISGISMSAGSAVLTNNQISITNGANTNGIGIDGILSKTANTPTLYYNSVYVGGTATAGAANSYAFLRTGTGTTILTDNLLYNGRTGGTGRHCAIGNTNATPATGWAANAANYNLLVSANASTIGEWGAGSGMDFATWKTSSAGDGNSWSTDAGSVSSANLFIDANNGNLNINTTTPEAWYVNGRGVQVAGQTADYGSASAGRSTLVVNGSTDIGSDEMVPSSAPPAPTVTGAIGVGNTQTFTFAGRTLGTIQWVSGTLPTSINWAYRPGTNPPNGPNHHYSNGYWTITPTGGGVYSATLTLNYDPAMLGTAVEANLKIGKKPTTVWTYLAASVGNTTTKSVSVTGQTSFGDFTLTDNISPLPVRLESFTANAAANNINLEWLTADESNIDAYILEHSANGTDYTTLTTVNAKGDHSRYMYKDAATAPGVNYYRLRMMENTGDFSYSSTATALISMIDHPGTGVAVYPNPTKDILNVTISHADTAPVKLDILDMTGRVVYTTSVSSSKVAIDIKGLPAGTYQLQYGDGGQKEMIRFIKN